MKSSNQNLWSVSISRGQFTAGVHYSFFEKRSDHDTPRPPWLMLAAICTILLLTSCKQETQNVKIYPAPDGIELSQAYEVEVQGKEVPLYKTKIPPGEPIPRLNHSRSEFGFASFALFDMGGEVEIKVSYPEVVSSVKVLRTSFGIKPKINGNSVVFELDEPRNLTIEGIN